MKAAGWTQLIFSTSFPFSVSEFRPRWMKYNEKIEQKKAYKASGELKTNQQILKERLKKQKAKAKHSKSKGKGGKGGGKKGGGKKRGTKRW